eukprot:TRINITY_DN13377_c0_g1_i1.p1 TRINITY_DN13377_c0_g1~~TRINITY_DN13377_c0_g1_i1.p1  ORF type:complete len:289 (-),score=37.20 TRINITY_DN13377_c0_g1_i1:202-1068(-)
MLATIHQPLQHNDALAVLASHLGEHDPQLKEELAYCGILTIKLDRAAEVWVGIDQRVKKSIDPASLKVLVVMEPPDVKDISTTGFDVVLTWHAHHLAELTHAHLFVPATPWLIPVEWPQLHGSSKRAGLGFLRGNKRTTKGHILRHDVWEARGQLEASMKIPIDFLEGGVSRNERNKQFLNKFVLVIENSTHANYFTEKLLDAILAQCVPIYWGCSNIESFFDPAGIIALSGETKLDEVLEICSKLTADDYDSREDAVKRNFELAQQYAGDFGQRVQVAIEKALSDRT